MTYLDNQGSIIFQDARIPKKYMVIPNPDILKAMNGQGLAYVNGGMAVVFAGLQRRHSMKHIDIPKAGFKGGS